MKPLSNPQKKKILQKLNQQYGITKLPYLILQFGKEKYRLYSGNLSKEELFKLDRTLKIENIGLYFAKQHANDELRLTLDGVQLFKEQITKNLPIMTIYLIPEYLTEKEHFPIYLDEFIPFLEEIRTSETITQNKMKISAIGKWYDMPGRAVEAIKKTIEETKDYDEFFLNFCINYDGQEEIVDACKLIARKIKAEKLDVDAINKQLIKDNIYSSYFLPHQSRLSDTHLNLLSPS